MAEHEFYRSEIVIEVTGEEGARAKLRAMDRYLEQTKKRSEQLSKVKVSPAARLIDRVSAPLRLIRYNLDKLGTVKKVTVQAVDKASGAIKSIIQKATSPLALLGAGSGMYGLGKLTLGAAAVWETQAVSMEHWLQGNKRLAQEFTSWLDRLADITPFEMEDLFPAATRAIGITDGDIAKAQRLTKLAADMAGLTPGKTVRDAMEALADAAMGEFERLKEFQMKMTKEEMQRLGGFEGFLKQAEKRFAGGSQKLSETAIGRLSTITDNIKKLFRKAGQGALEVMKPALDKIVWKFTQNEKGLKRLQDRFASFGRSFGNAVVAKLEQGYRWFEKITANKAFQRMSFGDKFIYLLDKGLDEISKWLDGPGGAKMQKVFVKLGQIAARAWVHALIGSIKISGSALLHGDFIGVLAGLGAFLKLGGGALVKGGFNLGKGIFKMSKAAKGVQGAIQATTVAAETAVAAKTAATGAKVIYGPGGQIIKTVAPLAQTAGTAAKATGWGAKALGLAGTVGKIAGKAAMPLAIGAEVFSVATAKDKIKAASQSAGGLAGMAGGAKLGALIGTVIAPGIGTAIGAAVGGLGGYFGGKWIAGKAVDAARGGTAEMTGRPAQIDQSIFIEVTINNTGSPIDEEKIAERIARRIGQKVGKIYQNSVAATKLAAVR